MSAGAKRIPKRSILGSRVGVRADDGWWRLGVVTAMRTEEYSFRQGKEQAFSVRLDGERAALEYREQEIVGPGFRSSIPPVGSLNDGQFVYITHGGREVGGRVVSHDVDLDEVRVDVASCGVVTKRLEEVRLQESRKSARLVNSDTDFSRLADFNIVEQRKKLSEAPPQRRRLHSMSDVPDRRRRASEADRKRQTERRRQRSERGAGSASIDVPSLVNG